MKLMPGWDWPDLFPAAVETAAMLDQVEHGVDLLLHVPDSHPSPASALPMFDAMAAMPAFTHPNARRVVLISTDSHIRSLMTLFRYTYPGQGESLLHAETPQAALALLQVLRTTGSLDLGPNLTPPPPYVP